MKQKQQRYWERLQDGRFAVYDAAWPAWSRSVSLVDNLAYYRNNFDLQPVATVEPRTV